MLKNLAMEGLKALRREKLTIHADQRDVELVRRRVVPLLLSEAEKAGIEVDSVEVVPLERQILGGLMIGATGGNVIYDNTFDSRIYRLQNEIRAMVYREICPE